MALSAARIAEVRSIFQQFDANNDGVIAPDELLKLIGALGGDTSEAGIAAALADFDKNQDGLIEF